MKMVTMATTLSLACSAFAGSVTDYNVIWDSPSKDYNGSMPLGNGDIGLNAWVEPSGDLAFYISKTDAWGDNARLLKVGRVRVTCEPPLVQAGGTFRQELDLETGTLKVSTSNAQHATSNVHVWCDANHPTINVAIDAQQPVTATLSIELWRTNQYTLPSIECSDVMTDRSKPKNMHGPTIVEPDTVLTGLRDRIGWCHHNVKSVGPAVHAEVQGMIGYPRQDPLLHRTFGAVVTAENGKHVDDLHLESRKAKSHRFSIHVLTEHPSSPEQWIAAMNALIASTESTPFTDRRRAHEAWWRAFWNRSWIQVTSNANAKRTGLIPKNKHAVHIGVDPTGGNRLQGDVARVSVLSEALPATRIEALAKAERTAELTDGKRVLYTGTPKPGDALPGSKAWNFDSGLTLEAWVKPAKLPGSGARIIDDVTPAGSDGFLLDTWPGNSLRFICGQEVLQKKNALPAGEWTHVAATVDASNGMVQLYANGAVVAEKKLGAGDDAQVVSRAYALQRFVDACAGRGHYPIKFNGSIFTVPYPGRPGDGDYRRWGPGYWWQNTRLPYLSMCASGDFEMMEPLFRMYVDDFLPLNIYRTKHYFGFEDAAYYIECVQFWGDVFNETYGWTPMENRKDPLQASGYHKWEWVAGPELVWMMLDCYAYTRDENLLKQRIIPTATAIMRFFDQYYKTNDAGTLVMHPAQALETWWDCTNPMPELAGLRAITARLLALPDSLTPADKRTYWKTFRAKLPPLPTREVEGGARALAPAEKFAAKRNCENPELYAVFPFRRCSFDKENRELGIQALKHRWDRGHFGWRQDDIFMAYLGLADEAKEFLVSRARSKHAGSRFPAFWGPNYDWVPDQDHGGVLMKALQAMLIQAEGDKIYLLPAWPQGWDADFKLHAPKRTVVQGRVKNGDLTELSVTPESRRRDVIIVPAQGKE